MSNVRPHHALASTRRRRPAALVAALVIAAGVLLGWSPEAEAFPRVVRPGTRPWVFIFGLGPSLGMHAGGYRAARLHQFKLQQDIGGHFSGDAEGPALGASFEESFANSHFRFESGVKFWWDIQLVDDLGLYLAPEGRWGFGLSTFSHSTDFFFNMQYGLSGRLILADRAIVFFKPITVDLNIGQYVAAYWDIMAGGGVTW